ncbi:acetyl-CoA carboxylase biotin carboxylase subunit family protein [Streptomyces sp. NPDC090306]|uniref:ATP-grasp domain-containing protein n=1 Tax=Streptomyces sp. NPDC090306 TaxID=3365961 RepID=UPI00380F7DE0
MGGEPVIAIIYERGAVSPAEIAVGLAGLGTRVFAVPKSGSEHVRRVRPLLAQLGDVVELTGDPVADADQLRSRAPTAILTFSESQLRTTARLASALGLSFHDEATTRLLTDKFLQRQRLREAGVDEVRSFLIRSMEDWSAASAETRLPAVVKPVQGEGGRNTVMIGSDAEAAELLPEMLSADSASSDDEPVLVVEELLLGRPTSGIVGDYVSVESVCSPWGISHLAVTGKFPLVPPFRETGVFWPAPLPPEEQEEILELTTRALLALGVGLGLTHTEIKITPSGPRIIEVNGRIGGHVNLLARHACGVDLVRLAGLLALGERVDIPSLRSRKVHFLRNVLAPTEPCEFIGVYGDGDVRAIPDVDGYRPYVRKGDRLPGGVMTQFLDLLWGTCNNLVELSAVLEEATAALSYEFMFDTGPCRVRAAELLG